MAELTFVNVGLACLGIAFMLILIIVYSVTVTSCRASETERQRELYYLERNHGDKAAAWNEYVNDLLDGLEDDINDCYHD